MDKLYSCRSENSFKIIDLVKHFQEMQLIADLTIGLNVMNMKQK